MQGLRALRKGAEGLEVGGCRIGKTPVGHSSSGRAWLCRLHWAPGGTLLTLALCSPAAGPAQQGGARKTSCLTFCQAATGVTFVLSGLAGCCPRRWRSWRPGEAPTWHLLCRRQWPSRDFLPCRFVHKFLLNVSQICRNLAEDSQGNDT